MSNPTKTGLLPERLVRNFPSLSSGASAAMAELLAGKTCIASAAVVSELGRLGLAHRFDLRGRSRRIVLTAAGASFIPGKKSKP